MESSTSSAVITESLVTADQLKRDIELVAKLEDYCSSGEFTQVMQEFGDSHAQKFVDTEDQPIECYALYQEFCKLLDEKLNEFLKQEGLVADELYKSCQRVQQMDSQSLMCLDWILASTEYTEFVTMMLEFKDMQNWDGEHRDYDYQEDEEEELQQEDDQQS